MSSSSECMSVETCCLHSFGNKSNGLIAPTATSLLNVALSFEDMQPFTPTKKDAEDELARQIDALTSRLKIAQFITKVLTQRIEELQAARKQMNEPSGTESGTEVPAVSLLVVQENSPEIEQVPSKPVAPILQRRHTTTATGLNLNLKDKPTAGWEERAAAFMLKRRNQKTAMDQHIHTPVPRSNPFDEHYSTRSSDVRHAHGLSSSEFSPSSPGPGHDQDVVWDFERKRQNPRRGALIAAAWITYCDLWSELDSRTATTESKIFPYLTFATIPWPVFRASSDPPFREPSEITIEEVRDFVLSPFHSMDKSKETRIRDTSLRFHPDKLSRWLNFVVLSERTKVREGVEKVNWCLNNLK